MVDDHDGVEIWIVWDQSVDDEGVMPIGRVWGVFSSEERARQTMAAFGVDYRVSMYGVDYRWRHRRRIKNHASARVTPVG